MVKESTKILQKPQVDETSLGYMLRLAAPMVVSTISLTLMQFVDRFMVSRLGTNALAAILPAAFVAFVPGAFAMGAMTSLNTFVSQSLGRGKKRECAHYFWQMTYMGLVYFAFVVTIMWLAAPWIFMVINQPSDVAELEVVYIRIVLLAHIAAVVNWSSNSFFMGIHRPIITMYATLCGQVVNIIASYVLIFGKLGLPRMGIAGAGWGMFIGITTAAGINMTSFLSRSMDTNFQSRKTLKIDFGKMYDLLRVGLPAAFASMANVALWGVVLVGLVGKFGTEALAATSVVLAYTNLSVMPVVGMSAALTAAVGKAIGSGRKEIAARQTSLCLRIAILSMGLLGICFFLFRHKLMLLWSSDEKVVRTGADILICAAVYQVFHAARIVYAGSLQGAGDTLWLAAISAVGAFAILGVGGILMITFLPSLGAVGPWIAAMSSIIAIGMANRWRFKSNKWMKIDLFKRQAAGVPIQIDIPE